ncbi:MAG: riboflavin kinase, archaea type, partial [Thermoproteota archaeon]|nr:riboflavin kinase, archaea type [Thermoproteota archaeon]
MKPTLWYTLYKLSELGATKMNIKVSTSSLAKNLRLSQQTASRHLFTLEKMDYIARLPSFKGIEVKITNSGIEELREVFSKLKVVFEKPQSTIIIEGEVFSGLGEGAYYINNKGYMHQFQRTLGFSPYPGTLNLKLSPSELLKKKELETYPPVVVEGFMSGGRTFGNVKCYPTIINERIDGAILLIHRTHYDESIIEVIAPVHLRDSLGLKEGSKVQLKIFP